MRAAGVDRIGGALRLLELPEPGPPRTGEVLIEVRASGVGNWDEIARAGGWDLGTRPPMALGVQAAGTVAAVGADVRGFGVGDAVTTHSLPGGSWAERFTAAADHLAPVPDGVSLAAAGALPVPALTADQALDAVAAGPGQTVLVNGASGVTGGLLVQLAVQRGARVIATAGHPDRPRSLGAEQVLDYHRPQWPEQVRADAAGHDYVRPPGRLPRHHHDGHHCRPGRSAAAAARCAAHPGRDHGDRRSDLPARGGGGGHGARPAGHARRGDRAGSLSAVGSAGGWSCPAASGELLPQDRPTSRP
jgi:D-arabinose 1-dehydrogenase-like Zn-dependent alcohol dehydrogenase